MSTKINYIKILMSFHPRSTSFHRVIVVHRWSQPLSYKHYVFVLRSCIIMAQTIPTQPLNIELKLANLSLPLFLSYR